jgi:hypothetical protein
MTFESTDTVERNDGMDDENYHTREVYAYFGARGYHAQVLEYGVVKLLTIAKIFPEPTTVREMFDPVMDQYFSQVFGKLVKEVTPYLGDDVESLTDLKRAVAIRRSGTTWRLIGNSA